MGPRLAWHIRSRAVGHGEDPRYARCSATLAGSACVVRKVFLVQGVAVSFIALPWCAAAAHDVDVARLVVVGVAVWAVGMVFETVGDAQLAAYRGTPSDQSRR